MMKYASPFFISIIVPVTLSLSIAIDGIAATQYRCIDGWVALVIHVSRPSNGNLEVLNYGYIDISRTR